MSTSLVALDGFAGHGWGVACKRLGIEEHGIEIMPEARAIRAANGMSTPFADIWDVLQNADPASLEFQAAMQIMSPPCQKFSMAGKGTGRTATAEVLRLIDERAYLRPADLRAFAAEHEDDGIALVLTPLALVAKHAPTYVVWEQVPPVLPVWERAADEMRGWGYSVWTGILNAEQYGVPQTRRRAVLIARADGKEAVPPTPTHSRYYPRDPKRLDPGVLPWVSMAEALDWGMTERPVVTVTAGSGRQGGPDPLDGGSGARATLRKERERGAWMIGHNYPDSKSATRQNERQRRAVDTPASTIMSGTRGALWEARPATTIAGDSRVWPPGHKVNASDVARLGEVAHERYGDHAGTNAERVTVAEAAALQSYPADFVWDVMVDTPRGPKSITKTKQFLTIGNAVPPLMAEAILKAAIS